MFGVFAVALSCAARLRARVPRSQMLATADSADSPDSEDSADSQRVPEDKEEDEEERLGPYYHYTNEEGADAINESGTLKHTEVVDDIDAVGGAGIYVTDLDPEEHSKTDILENNYGGESPENDDKADYYVGFTVSTERWDVEEVRDHVYVITDKNGDGQDMRVTGSDTIAREKPEYHPNKDDDHEDVFDDDFFVFDDDDEGGCVVS